VGAASYREQVMAGSYCLSDTRQDIVDKKICQDIVDCVV